MTVGANIGPNFAFDYQNSFDYLSRLGNYRANKNHNGL